MATVSESKDKGDYLNFAIGRNTRFSTDPYFPGTTDPDDNMQLTDGVIDTKGDFYSKQWVGWGDGAPTVAVWIRLGGANYVSSIRLHYVDPFQAFKGIKVWSSFGTDPVFINSADINPKLRIGWTEIPVNTNMISAKIEIFPVKKRTERFLFIDEIEILGWRSFFSRGEVVFDWIKLLPILRGGTPVLSGEVPEGTSAELWYRRKGDNHWRKNSWNKDFLHDLVQFKIVLYSNSENDLSPLISDITFK